MLLFDWTKIFAKSKGKPKEIVRIIKMMTEGSIPKNKYDKTYKYANDTFVGSSFLVHPDVLMFNSYKYDYPEVATYIAVASLRPLAEYYSSRTTTLNLLNVDDSLFKYIDENRLLTVEDGIIHFLYEEVPQKEILH